MEKVEVPTLEEYEKQLRDHDWYYQMSDDSFFYNRGFKNNHRLLRIARDGGQEYQDLYLKIQGEKTNE